MKHVLYLLVVLSGLFAGSLRAQEIAVGDRFPEFKNSVWLDDRKPAAAPVTFYEFFHSTNDATLRSLDRLRELTDKSGAKLRIVVLAKEPAERIAPILRSYLSPYAGVMFDPEGRAFAACGVKYLPFGVLVDARNRVLWMGNSLKFGRETLDQVTK